MSAGHLYSWENRAVICPSTKKAREVLQNQLNFLLEEDQGAVGVGSPFSLQAPLSLKGANGLVQLNAYSSENNTDTPTEQKKNIRGVDFPNNSLKKIVVSCFPPKKIGIFRNEQS